MAIRETIGIRPGYLPEHYPERQVHRRSVCEQSPQAPPTADPTEFDPGTHHEEEGQRGYAGFLLGVPAILFNLMGCL